MDDVILLLLIIVFCAIIGRTAANWSRRLTNEKFLKDRETGKELDMK